MSELETRTGRLFGDLWHYLDDEQFEQSVALFASRFEANGFDLSWFEGKKCLDVGCGGGRYTIAIGRLGAGQVVGRSEERRVGKECRSRWSPYH